MHDDGESEKNKESMLCEVYTKIGRNWPWRSWSMSCFGNFNIRRKLWGEDDPHRSMYQLADGGTRGGEHAVTSSGLFRNVCRLMYECCVSIGYCFYGDMLAET